MFSARYKKLGAKISYYRKLKGLKQAELASATALSSSYISEIECGSACGCPLSVYWRIAEALGVEFEELLKD